jgi:hypothetical protein
MIDQVVFSNSYYQMFDASHVLEFFSRCRESAEDSDSLLEPERQKDKVFGHDFFQGQGMGKCQCPSGKIYDVADQNNECSSLACDGGRGFSCNQNSRTSTSKTSVKCAPSDPNLKRRSPCVPNGMTALIFWGTSKRFHKLYDNRKTLYTGQAIYRHETRNFFLDVEYIEEKLSLSGYSFKQWPHYVVVLKPKDLSLRARRILKIPFDLNMGWGNSNEIFSRPMAVRADTNDNLLFIRKMDSTHVIPLKHYEVMIDVNQGNNKGKNVTETPQKLQRSRLLLATANIAKLTVHLASKHSGIPINYQKSAMAGARHRKLAEINPPKTKTATSSLSLVARDVIKNKSTYLTKFKFTYVPDINKWDPQCRASHLAGKNVPHGGQFSVNLHDLCQGAMIELNRRDIKNDPLVTIDFFEHKTYNVVAPKETNFIYAFST